MLPRLDRGKVFKLRGRTKASRDFIRQGHALLDLTAARPARTTIMFARANRNPMRV